MDGRHGDALVSDGGVELAELLLEAGFLFVEDVGLVEEQDDGHIVCLCTCEEAVDEGGGRLRMSHSYDEHGLVDVGSDDVALSGEVLRPPYDVVASVVEGSDDIFLHRHPVADGDGVGGSQLCLPDSEVALEPTLQFLAVVGEDGVPGACVLDDNAGHVLNIQEFRSSGVAGVAGVEELRSCRSSGVAGVTDDTVNA